MGVLKMRWHSAENATEGCAYPAIVCNGSRFFDCNEALAVHQPCPGTSPISTSCNPKDRVRAWVAGNDLVVRRSITLRVV